MNTANTIIGFNQVVVPAMRAVSQQHPNEQFEFEGDNARAHTAVAFRNYLATLPWPSTPFGGHPVNALAGRAPNSPDMCYIEYLFGYWEERVKQRDPQTVHNLIRVAEEEWARIPIQVVQRTVMHMLPVMESIEANGGAQYGYQ